MDNDILMDFSIPANELNAEMMVGDHGRLIVDVEVIGRVDDRIIFRKHGRAKADGSFKAESSKQMKERMLASQEPETEDEE